MNVNVTPLGIIFVEIQRSINKKKKAKDTKRKGYRIKISVFTDRGGKDNLSSYNNIKYLCDIT